MRSGLRTVSLVLLSLSLAVQAHASIRTAVHHKRVPGKHHFLSARPKASNPGDWMQEEPQEAPVVLTSPSSHWKNEDERGMLVRVARSFAGAPYKWGGDTVRGLDCSAFVRKMYGIFEVRLPRSAQEQFCAGSRVNKDDLAVGDLVFFKTRHPARYPTHVGIYIGDGQFIHTSSFMKRGVRIDRLSDAYFSRTYAGAVRVRTPPAENSDAS
jgi:peptidoglycan endopeptidase LytE